MAPKRGRSQRSQPSERKPLAFEAFAGFTPSDTDDQCATCSAVPPLRLLALAKLRRLAAISGQELEEEGLLPAAHPSIAITQEGWERCVGPLAAPKGEEGDFATWLPVETHACGNYFRPQGRRIKRVLRPACPTRAVCTTPGFPTPPGVFAFCVCDARMDLCPSCQPVRRPCPTCAGLFCQLCLEAHRPSCEAVVHSVCGGEVVPAGPWRLVAGHCGQRMFDGLLSRCGGGCLDEFDPRRGSEAAPDLPCEVRSCGGCRVRCRGAAYFVLDTDSAFGDQPCTAMICQGHEDGLCARCQTAKREGRLVCSRPWHNAAQRARSDALPKLFVCFAQYGRRSMGACDRADCIRCADYALQRQLTARIEVGGEDECEAYERMIRELPPDHVLKPWLSRRSDPQHWSKQHDGRV